MVLACGASGCEFEPRQYQYSRENGALLEIPLGKEFTHTKL